MKIFTTLLFTFSMMYVAHATIHTVNSDPNFDADFTSLSAAITAATAGDTIQLYGASASYGSITIDKQLTIYGPGYFLNDNPTPAQQTITTSAEVSTTVLSSTATGTKIQGLYINGNLRMQADTVVIENCRVDFAIFGNEFSGTPIAVDSVIFRENYCGGIDIYDGSSNIIITNNYLSSDVTTQQVTSFNFSDIVIKNNTFIGPSSNCCIAENAVVENNISAHTNTSSGAGSFRTDGATYGMTYLNNLGTNPSSLTGNGNQASIALTDMSGNILFEGYPTANGFSSDSAYQLISGSAAIGAGTNGDDCGMFGGINPYNLSGIAEDIPNIYELNITGSTPTLLNVNIKAKGNN